MPLTPEEKRERSKLAMKKWRAKNPERQRAISRRASVKYRKKNPIKSRAWWFKDPRNGMLAKAKQRAARDGVPFSITANDFAVPQICPLLGLPLHVSIGTPSPNSPSLDRVKPSLGYVPGNVWVISHRANALKRDASLKELEQILKALRTRMLDPNQI